MNTIETKPVNIAATVADFLAANGLNEWTPVRVFVVGSPRKTTSPIAPPWIDFEIDEQRGGRWFRVTYSLLLTEAGTGLQVVCMSPSGIPHYEDMSLGDAALAPQNRCNGYDLAFLAWYQCHGWQIHGGPTGVSVWTNGDAKCPFTVTRGMIERLDWNGHIERIFPKDAAVLDYVWHLKAA